MHITCPLPMPFPFLRLLAALIALESVHAIAPGSGATKANVQRLLVLLHHRTDLLR